MEPREVTITGTRDTGHRQSDDYAALFACFIRPFASAATTFYLGGAVGIDSLALLWLAKETGSRLQKRLGELVELGLEARTAGYHTRNRWMVDHSSFVIGFPLSGTEGGGTGYTLEYAKEQHKPRLVVPI